MLSVVGASSPVPLLSSADHMIAGLTQTQAAAYHSVSSAGTVPNSPELATVLFSLRSENGNRLVVGAAGALLYGALLLYTSGFSTKLAK